MSKHHNRISSLMESMRKGLVQGKHLRAFQYEERTGAREYGWSIIRCVMAVILALCMALGVVVPNSYANSYAIEKTTDLANTINLKDTSINGTSITNISEIDVAKGEILSIKFSFASDAHSYKFADMAAGDHKLYYDLPAGFAPAGGKDEVRLLPLTISGHPDKNAQWYFEQANDGHWRIVVDFTDLLAEDPGAVGSWDDSTNSTLSLEYDFELAQSPTEMRLPGNKTITFTETNSSLDGAKSAYYDKETGRVKYTVTVKAKGDSDNIQINDVLKDNSDLLTLDPNSIKIEGGTGAACSAQGETINCSVASMKHNETLTITYDAEVNKQAWLDANEQTRKDVVNTVKYKADDIAEQEVPKGLPDIDVKSSIEKKGSVTGEDGNTRTITWEVAVNKECDGSLKGKPITDSLQTGTLDKGSINIQVYDANGTPVSGAADMTRLSATDTGFTYNVPENDGNYKYVITYTSTVSVKGAVDTFDVANTVTTPYSTKEAKVPVTSNVTFEKPAKGGVIDDNTIHWTITAPIPTDVKSVTITDTLPDSWVGELNTHVYDDYKDGTAQVKVGETVLDPGDYTMNTDGHQVTVTLTESGLTKAQGHTVTVQLDTELNGQVPYDQHINKVDVKIVDNTDREHTKEDQAQVTPEKTQAKAKKSLSDRNGNEIHNPESTETTTSGLPVWYFRVMVPAKDLQKEPLKADDVLTFPEGSGLSWDDFELYAKDSDNLWDKDFATKYFAFDTNGEVIGSYAHYASVIDEHFDKKADGSVTITFPQYPGTPPDNQWKNAEKAAGERSQDVAYYGYVYGIYPKDKETADRLVQLALEQTGNTVTMNNKVGNDPDQQTNFSYKVTPLMKSLSTKNGDVSPTSTDEGNESISGKDGKIYNHVWLFRVIVDEDLIPSGGTTVTDTFDTNLFKVLTVEDVPNPWDFPWYLRTAFRFRYDNGQLTKANGLQKNDSSHITGSGPITFDFPGSDTEDWWPADTTGKDHYVGYIYALVPKDDAALRKIQELSAENDDFAAVFSNTARMEGTPESSSVEVDFTFQEKPMNKSVNIDNIKNREVTFTIDVNPDKLTIGSTGYIDIYDEMTEYQNGTAGLRFDPTSVEIIDKDTNQSVKSDSKVSIEGNQIRFTVPDGKHLEITYLTRVIGPIYKEGTGQYADGTEILEYTVSFNNSASLLGYESATHNENQKYQSNQAGSSSGAYLKILKHAEGNVLAGIPGVKFELYFVESPETDTSIAVKPEQPVKIGEGVTDSDGVLMIGFLRETGGKCNTTKFDYNNPDKIPAGCLIPRSTMRTDTGDIVAVPAQTEGAAQHLVHDDYYVIKEVSAPEGYVVDSTPIKVRIPRDFDQTDADNWLAGATRRVANGKGSFSVRKVEEGKEKTEGGLQGATICYSPVAEGSSLATVDDLTDDMKTNKVCVTTDDTGEATFGSIDEGSYAVWEQEAPDGYIGTNKVYAMEVSKHMDGSALVGYDVEITGMTKDPLINTDSATTDAVTGYIISNERKSTPPFAIQKVDTEEETKKLSGATFCAQLKGKDQGTPVCATSGTDGMAIFDKLDAGTYVLSETGAPSGYVKTNTTWTLVVAENGSMSVNDGALKSSKIPYGTGELDVYSYTVSNTKSDEPEGIVLPSAGDTGMFFTLELGVLIVGFGLWAGKRAMMTDRTAVNHHGQ